MRSLTEIGREAAGCTRCDLHKRATGTVFGAGPEHWSLMLVGEQPGDIEDKRGQPFVGPAGHVLDRALRDTGIERSEVYLTNAVKHFKWEESGKRRLHKPPNRAEIVACRKWLEEELTSVAPAVVVALGSTAGSALIGPGYRVGSHRGEPAPITVGKWHGLLVGTIHPSAVLRSGSGASRDQAYAGLVADLRVAVGAL